MRRTSTSKTRVGFRDHYEELYSRISESDLLTARDPLLRFRVSERILLIKRFLIDASARTKGCCLLDLGCAEGFLFPYVINLGYTYIAVARALARVNLLKVRKSGATYLVQADAEHLPFRNQSFYIIICTEVLEHLENPLAALREISRVGKYALISTPLVGCPFIVDSLIANRRAMFLTLRSRLLIREFGYKKALDLVNKMFTATHINCFTWSILSKMIFRYFDVIKWRGTLFYFPGLRTIIGISMLAPKIEGILHKLNRIFSLLPIFDCRLLGNAGIMVFVISKNYHIHDK